MELNESRKLRERLQVSVDLLRRHEQVQTDLQGKLQNAKEIQADLSKSKMEIESFLGRISGLVNNENLEGSPACHTELEDKDRRPTSEEFESRLAEILNRWSQEVKALEATSDKLREEVRTFESRLMDKDAEIAARNNRVTKLQAELGRETTKASRKLKHLNVRNEKLQARAAQEIAGMREVLSHAECENQKQLKTIQECLGREQQLQQQVHDHTVAIEAERAATFERIGKLKNIQKSQDRKVSLLNKQISQADQENVRLNLEIGGLNSNIEQNKRMLAEQANQLAAFQNGNAVLNHRLQLEVAGNIALHEHLQQITVKLQQERAESAVQMHRYQVRAESLELTLAEVQASKGKQVEAQTQTDVCPSESPVTDSSKLKVEFDILQEKNREGLASTHHCEQRMKDQCLGEHRKLNILETKHTQTSISSPPPRSLESSAF